MAKGPQGAILGLVHTLFNQGTVGGLTDAQLLERFSTRDGEAAELAFAALVERHGAMVLRTCRSVLHDEHEACDAFQVAFLVLARKARSLGRHDSVGPWLHEVACRTAACARSAATRRKAHERAAAAIAEARPSTNSSWNDTGPVLHEEVDRLPERFRLPLVLCYLEGLTHEQAAQQLKWPVGTVRSRLARGRDRLRGRLVRRGLAPGGVALGAAFSAEVASAAVPGGLAEATIQAAVRFTATRAAEMVSAAVVTLTGEVLMTMLMTKLKLTAMLALAACLIVTGAVALAQNGAKAQAPAAPKPPIAEALVQDIEAKNQAIRDKLEKKIDFNFDPVSLGNLLKYIKSASQGPNDSGIPIYVNPSGVTDVEVQGLRITKKNVPIRVGLKSALNQVGVSYEVRDGLLVIDSRAAIMENRLEDVERKLDQVLKALEGLKRDGHQ